MRAALGIARHEWRLVLKEPRFLLPFFIAPMLIVGVQAFALHFHPGAAEEILLLARHLLIAQAVLSASLAIPLGADSFAGERERNTLEILLCLPLRVRTIFWGKVLGIFPLPVLVGWTGQAAMLALVASRDMFLPGFPTAAAYALLLTPVLGLFFCSLGALISLSAESVRGAAQLTSLFMLAVLFPLAFLSGPLLRAPVLFGCLLAALLAGSAACLALAGRRFPRL